MVYIEYPFHSIQNTPIQLGFSYIYIHMLCCNPESLIVKYSRTLGGHKHFVKLRKSMSRLSIDFSLF